MRIIHQWTDEQATIRVEGLDEPVGILHFSDSHLGLIDQRDGQQVAACGELRDRFNGMGKDRQGRPVPTDRAFSEVISRASSSKIDLLALTGDMISFPSQANIEYVRDQIAQADKRVLYAGGNHEWHWPGLDYGSVVRAKYWPLLEPLHKGQPAQSATQIKGLCFLAIDNSDYQITDSQLGFTRENLCLGLPTVLLMHLPISVPTLRAATIEKWAAPILLGDAEHRNPASGKCWGPRLNPPMTVASFGRVMAFIKLLAGAENLLAILCGHVHFAHADPISPWAMQYVAPPGYEARYRVVEVGPL